MRGLNWWKWMYVVFVPYAIYNSVNPYCTKYAPQPALRISVGREAIQTVLQWVSCNTIASPEKHSCYVFLIADSLYHFALITCRSERKHSHSLSVFIHLSWRGMVLLNYRPLLHFFLSPLWPGAELQVCGKEHDLSQSSCLHYLSLLQGKLHVGSWMFCSLLHLLLKTLGNRPEKGLSMMNIWGKSLK